MAEGCEIAVCLIEVTAASAWHQLLFVAGVLRWMAEGKHARTPGQITESTLHFGMCDHLRIVVLVVARKCCGRRVDHNERDWPESFNLLGDARHVFLEAVELLNDEKVVGERVAIEADLEGHADEPHAYVGRIFFGDVDDAAAFDFVRSETLPAHGNVDSKQ